MSDRSFSQKLESVNVLFFKQLSTLILNVSKVSNNEVGVCANNPHERNS